ncbi:ABC transporter permease [Solilutibacter silvestris]|uniref:MacB-like periplasmic core domain-containing protein n=1 Tax=Solilutibacter silvestris TaxID=1645665 RepID=A0A2K1Q1V1_9GAMM|nr:ABC transporter permease [Lysobacter silvestris]PNS09015.1 MacB-like periplasmic core domain-containing protein [Lysobacter silvestris]
MLGYYFSLAWRSLRQNRALTVLMVLTLAVGIGATMTTLTVFKTLSRDPIPQKSDRLFRVQLDMYPADVKNSDKEPPYDISRFDAETLLAQRHAKAQVVTVGGSAPLEIDNQTPFSARMRFTSADFFPMFLVPIRYGHGWNANDDASRARVAVLSDELNQKIFGGANSVGKTIRIQSTPFTVVGVAGHWRPDPRYYDINTQRYGNGEEVYLPFSTSRDLSLGMDGNMDCFKASNDDNTSLNAPCVWLQYWVELESPTQANDFRAYLSRYSEQQRAAGRYSRPPNARLRSVTDWLDYRKIVPSDAHLQLWLALGFLVVCLVNVVGLLMAKFLRKQGEIGVRRALGATRRDIFIQFLMEAGVVGLVGSVGGLLLSLLGLWAVRHQPTDYAEIVHLDPAMLALTIVLGVIATLLAGLLPAFRAMRIAPAIQLKTQ